jgi:hypothetical protein
VRGFLLEGLLNFAKRGESGVFEWLAGTFAAANVIIGVIFIGPVWLLVSGRLFPVSPSVARV